MPHHYAVFSGRNHHSRDYGPVEDFGGSVTDAAPTPVDFNESVVAFDVGVDWFAGVAEFEPGANEADAADF